MTSPQPAPADQHPERSELVTVVLAIAGSIGYVGGVFGFTIAASIALFIALFAAVLLTGSVDQFETFLTGDGMIVLFGAEAILLGIGTVLATVISVQFGWVHREEIGFRVPSGREILVGIGAVFALLGLATALSIIIETLGVPPSEHSLFDEEATWVYYVSLAVLSILLIGPVEELLFRGLIQNYVRPALGGVGAVVWTSLLFAVVHLPAYFTDTLETAALSLVVVFALSLVLGAVYERYRNIVLVMAIHGLYNAVLFSVQLF